MIYFNSQSIPELQGLNFSQRMQVVRMAADKLAVPVKISLNVLKLAILSVLFIMVARAEGWAIVGYALVLIVAYPLITRPITFFLCRDQFAKIRRQQFPEQQ
ncbi:DUF6170 family protein [Alishewanella tabrizica]|uniref:Inner membrane protein n=1 Tax=Alishewanella tabrizica TaxID=671278 RepID=A0ABQ2WJQ7_9ALTE|nr:DUF6170 family protein [Alishewanella tabrizica]GGW58984.1 hypothetical protein GCM10008111_13760 [Alishewanella tabrizica]